MGEEEKRDETKDDQEPDAGHASARREGGLSLANRQKS